jgi:hypothetical protein
METAVAAAEAIDPGLEARIAEVRPLGLWVPAPGVPPGGPVGVPPGGPAGVPHVPIRSAAPAEQGA